LRKSSWFYFFIEELNSEVTKTKLPYVLPD